MITACLNESTLKKVNEFIMHAGNIYVTCNRLKVDLLQVNMLSQTLTI